MKKNNRKKPNFKSVAQLSKTLIENPKVHLSRKNLLDLGFFGSDCAMARIKVLDTLSLFEMGRVSLDGDHIRIIDLGLVDLIELGLYANPRLDRINVSGVPVDMIYEVLVDHEGNTHKRDVLYKVAGEGRKQ